MEVCVDPIKLYRQAANGKLQVWSISAEVDIITIRWGEEHGQLQEQTEEVECGLAGRSIEEQVLSRVTSRINGKIDQGYSDNRIFAINNKPVNRMGLKKPMLAAKLDTVKDIDFPSSVVQCKYDGHRCLINRDGDEYQAYSRNGKAIETIPEIVDAVRKSHLPDGYTLDGELYHHGSPLQTITSWVKRRQPMTSNLAYIVYDIITPDEKFYSQRFQILINLNLKLPIQIAPTDANVTEEQIPFMLDESIKAGYEGLILRRDGFAYQDGKRSKGLVKIKQWIDDEFKVISIKQSTEGYAVLRCIMNSGVTFEATAPGSMEEKFVIWMNKDSYIGKFVNVQYANLTKAGKPFHPIATMWRNKDEE
jgi:DNA ligase-1